MFSVRRSEDIIGLNGLLGVGSCGLCRLRGTIWFNFESNGGLQCKTNEFVYEWKCQGTIMIECIAEGLVDGSKYLQRGSTK